MIPTQHHEDNSSGGIAAFGLFVTILATVAAFWVAGTGLLDSSPKVRVVFIEKATIAAIKPEIAQVPGGLDVAVQEPNTALPIIQNKAAGG